MVAARLKAVAAAHPSPHGFRSGSNAPAPAHAVYESHADSLFAALANDNINISIKARYNHSEVNAQR